MCNESLLELVKQLRTDSFGQSRLRNDPSGCAKLMSLAQHGHLALDQALATTYLAITFADEPAVKAFLFDKSFDARAGNREAALHGFFANYGDDDDAIQKFVEGIGDLSPGPIADLLHACFGWSPFLGVGFEGPAGVSKDTWIRWESAAFSMRLPLLTHLNSENLLFDIMRRDPDGPVEWTLERILAELANPRSQPLWASVARDMIVHDLTEKVAALHSKWQRIEDYVREIDSAGERRLPGWMRRYQMIDNDLEHRRWRIARRMAQFPEATALRRTFENMLFDRPALFPQVGDECDYYRFEPIFWRHVAWATLANSHWTVGQGVEFADMIVSLGPWDNEDRKSKEAIEAVVRAWPQEETVRAFLTKTEHRTDVGAFVRDEMASLLDETRTGKDIGLYRDRSKA